MIFSIYGKALAVLAKKPFKLWGISLLSGLLVFLGYLFGGPVIALGMCFQYLITASMANIYLKGYHGDGDIHAADLFATFKNGKTIKRTACSLAWADLWIFLWGLIPIVGLIFAVIKTYEYRFVPYIVMEEEDVSVTGAKERSSELTRGYKSKMFWADVIFIVLTGVVGLILGLFARIPYIGVLFGIILFVYEICLAAFGGLFLNLVKAAFYDEVTGARNNTVYGDAPAAPAAEPATETATEQ